MAVNNNVVSQFDVGSGMDLQISRYIQTPRYANSQISRSEGGSCELGLVLCLFVNIIAILVVIANKVKEINCIIVFLIS